MADMTGQAALVTGGIRGIGLAICERLMNRGVKVAAGYSSNQETAQQFAEKYADHGVSIHQGNIDSNGDYVRVIGEVLDRHGQLDILVNNAGITVDKTVRKRPARRAQFTASCIRGRPCPGQRALTDPGLGLFPGPPPAPPQHDGHLSDTAAIS